MAKITMHHVLGNKVLEYDVNGKGVIVDEREYNAITYNDKYKDFYGVSYTYEEENTARTRIGVADYHKTLPLQSKMKGCTMTSDGVVKYLNPTDWTKYEDGSTRDYTLNTMVEIPEFWCLTVISDGLIELRLYQYEIDGAEHFPKSYCSAYEGYVDNDVLKSLYSDTNTPSVDITRANFQTYARANGNDHWNMYTYKIHKQIALLYLVEYANMNAQLEVNANLTSEGYKQGGIGVGYTEGAITVNGVTTYSMFNCGCTDIIGNNSGQIIKQFENTSASGAVISTVTRKANRYRGVENIFGQLLKNVIDVIGRYNDSTKVLDIYYTEDRTKFSDLTTNYEILCSAPTTTGLYKDMQYLSHFEIFPAPGTETNRDLDKYYSDYYWCNLTGYYKLIFLCGDVGSESMAGLWYIDCYHDIHVSQKYLGSRLTYIL